MLIEKRLGKNLLNLACRHHVMELIAKKAFEECFGTTTAPEVLLFKRFKEWLCKADQSRFLAMSQEEASTSLTSAREDLITRFNDLMVEQQPRADYRELLELSIIVLGGIPVQRGIRFKRPGALSHARWMAKVIYSLKIFLFRHQFDLKESEREGLQRFVNFAVELYVPAWFSTPDPVAAPANDLKLLKDLAAHEDKAMARALTPKLAAHMWYLSEELVPLALFDDKTSDNTKRAMMRAMEERQGADSPKKRAHVDLSGVDVRDATLADFATQSSKSFFRVFDIDDDWLTSVPSQWPGDPQYVAAAQKMASLQVTNDLAERGVALMEKFNQKITQDERQRQYLLQVVELHRQRFPKADKWAILPAL